MAAVPVMEPPEEPASQLVAMDKEEPEPVIKPIVIGNGEAPLVERKRGWWRR